MLLSVAEVSKLITTSLLLGVGLAMDACAVSMANGLNNPKMRITKTLLIAAHFALFQALMPLIGYFIGSFILSKIEWIIPWVALIILSIIGGKMLYDGIKNKDNENETVKKLTYGAIVIQAVATSIDALSVGFTIANYNVIDALICVGIVGLITFILCITAVFIGKKFGTKLGNKAEILGGIILIAIGIEIFISGMFF